MYLASGESGLSARDRARSLSAASSEIRVTSGLYYKHTMIVNYASSIINKLEALLTDDARVVIYDHHVFIVQATGLIKPETFNYLL